MLEKTDQHIFVNIWLFLSDVAPKISANVFYSLLSLWDNYGNYMCYFMILMGFVVSIEMFFSRLLKLIRCIGGIITILYMFVKNIKKNKV